MAESDSHVSVEDIRTYVENLSEDELMQLSYEADLAHKAGSEQPLIFYEPHDVQDAFHNDLHRFRFFFGGNSSGKTYAGSKEAVCHLLGYDPSNTTTKYYKKAPVTGWFGAVSKSKALRIMYQDIIPKLPKGEFLRFDKDSFTLFLRCGSKLQLMSYESDVSQWQSEAVDFVWLDEQPPYDKYDEAKSRVIRRMGYLWVTMTPFLAHSRWTYDEVVENQRDDKEITYFVSDISDNRYLTKEMQDMFDMAFTGTEEEQSRLHGAFSFLEGRVHPDFDKRVHVVNPFEFTDEFRAEFDFLLVIDLHVRNPCVANWFACKRSTPPLIYCVRELAMQDMHITEFGDKVNEYSKDIKPKMTIIDTPESKSDVVLGTSMRLELAQKGIAGINADRNFHMGVIRTNQYIKNGQFFLFSNCVYTIRKLDSYSWDNYIGKARFDRNLKEKPRDKDDHPVRNCHFALLTMPALNEILEYYTARSLGSSGKKYLKKENILRH